MHDPRRNWCEVLSWTYDYNTQDVCTMWDRAYFKCHSYPTEDNPRIWHKIGYIPSLCPQYPCNDWHSLHYGISDDPINMLTHYKLPSDGSGIKIKNDELLYSVFNSNSTNLGYLKYRNSRESEDRYVKSEECPNNMIGISYFYNILNEKSCTIEQYYKKDIIDTSSESELKYENFKQENCRTGAETTNPDQFLGCLFKNEKDCINSLKNIDYLHIKPPTKIQITFQLFYELFLNSGGKEIDGT